MSKWCLSMPRPPKDFSMKVIDSEFIDVTALAKKYDVDEVALEQYMREYQYFVDKRRTDNRTKRTRYEKIEEHLASAQRLLETSDIDYDDDAMTELIVNVQHTQDMLISKGVDRKQGNRILVRQLSGLHPKPPLIHGKEMATVTSSTSAEMFSKGWMYTRQTAR